MEQTGEESHDTKAMTQSPRVPGMPVMAIRDPISPAVSAVPEGQTAPLNAGTDPISPDPIVTPNLDTQDNQGGSSSAGVVGGEEGRERVVEAEDNSTRQTVQGEGESGEGPLRGVKLNASMREQLVGHFRDVLEERQQRIEEDEQGGSPRASSSTHPDFFEGEHETSVAGLEEIDDALLRPVHEPRASAVMTKILVGIIFALPLFVIVIWLLMPVTSLTSDDISPYTIASFYHTTYNVATAGTSLGLLTLVWPLTRRHIALTIAGTCVASWILVGPIGMASSAPNGFTLQIASVLAVGLMFVYICAWMVAVNDSQGRNARPNIRVRCAGHVGMFILVIAAFFINGMLVRDAAHPAHGDVTVSPGVVLFAVFVLKLFSLFAVSLAFTIDAVAPKELGMYHFVSFYSRVFFTSAFIHLLLKSRSSLSFFISIFFYLAVEAAGYWVMTRSLRRLRSIIRARDPPPPVRAHLGYENRVRMLCKDTFFTGIADCLAFAGYVIVYAVVGSSKYYLYALHDASGTHSVRWPFWWSFILSLVIASTWFVRRSLVRWWQQFQDPNWRPDGTPAPALSDVPVSLLHRWRTLAILVVSGTWGLMLLPLSLAKFGDLVV